MVSNRRTPGGGGFQPLNSGRGMGKWAEEKNGRLENRPSWPTGEGTKRYFEGRISFRSPPVYIPAMSDADNQNDEYGFAHFVKHTVIADPKPTQAPHIALERIAEEWILCQTVDSRDNPRSIRLDDPLQFLGRAGLNPYREDHA